MDYTALKGMGGKEQRPIRKRIDYLGNSYITVSPAANCAVTTLSKKLHRCRLAMMDNNSLIGSAAVGTSPAIIMIIEISTQTSNTEDANDTFFT